MNFFMHTMNTKKHSKARGAGHVKIRAERLALKLEGWKLLEKLGQVPKHFVGDIPAQEIDQSISAARQLCQSAKANQAKKERQTAERLAWLREQDENSSAELQRITEQEKSNYTKQLAQLREQRNANIAKAKSAAAVQKAKRAEARAKLQQEKQVDASNASKLAYLEQALTRFEGTLDGLVMAIFPGRPLEKIRRFVAAADEQQLRQMLGKSTKEATKKICQ